MVTDLGTLSDNFGTVIYDGVDQAVFSDVYYNLTAGGGSGTKTLGGAVTVAGNLIIDTDVIIAMGANDLTVTGATDNNGTVTISTATLDANGAFDATGGFVTFTNAGNLMLFSTVESLGTLSGNGTVTYDGTDQNIFGDAYYSLRAGGSGTKTLVGAVTVANDLIIDPVVTIAMGVNNLTVTDETDINGTITISTATLDADGTFDATGGFVTFTDAGNLNLFSTVTDLGTLSTTKGTVTYDGVNQTVFSDAYYNLTAGNSSGTKTLGGTVTVANDLVINAGVTIDVSSSDDYSISVGGALENNGTFSAQDGMVTFNGSDNQIFTPGSSSYYNITLNNAGDDKLLTIAGDLEVDHDLTLTDGTLDLETNDPAIAIAGDLAIADGAVWTKGNGTATFDGVTQSMSDANNTPNDLGDALINSPVIVRAPFTVKDILGLTIVMLADNI